MDPVDEVLFMIDHWTVVLLTAIFLSALVWVPLLLRGGRARREKEEKEDE